MEIANISFDYQLKALPPQAQEIQEMVAILKSHRLRELTYGEQILEMRRVYEGYVIETESFTVQVTVHYLPPIEPGWCGPARFELEFDLVNN